MEKDFTGCDSSTDLPIDDKFIKDTLKIDKIGKDEIKQFKVKADGWNSFPLYEIIDGKIVSFDYTKYVYFANTDRRVSLALKINDLYNPPSELKILRKTFKYIMDHLNMDYPDYFEKYNNKIEELIIKNPKN